MLKNPSQYHLYPCTDAEQMFQRVLHSQNSLFFSQALELDFAQSRFRDKPRFLFQNNALGEWFKVRLTQHQGLSIGLPVSHSREVLEHYLRLFFPQMQKAHALQRQENWMHPDIVSLLLFELLKGASLAQLQHYLPKALQQTLRLLKSQKGEARDAHLWGFAQGLAELFITYDQYRAELKMALESGDAVPEDASGETAENNFGSGSEPKQVEAWQQNLWRNVRRWTEAGFYWHGQLIEEVLRQGLRPQNDQGDSLQPEPLYIIGSGFLSSLQLAFYCYLSRFTTVHHFWLTPMRFPPELRRQAAEMLWGKAQTEVGQSCRVGNRKQYEARIQVLAEQLGGLPEFLWLENSLHSAALLSRDQTVQWHEESAQTQKQAQPAASLLRLVQQSLRDRVQRHNGHSEPSQTEQRQALLADGSIQYFACSDRRREVEVLKDQILAALDAHPEWQLNDIAVLAPDINQYQALIQSIFENSGQDYRLHCNFIDLRKGFVTVAGGAARSEYFSAFAMLLDFGQSRFRLDECLRFLESPCTRGAQLLQAKPGSFWRKVFRHWQLSWGIDQRQRQQALAAKSEQGQNDQDDQDARDAQSAQNAWVAEVGTWQGAIQRFVRDYTAGYHSLASQTADTREDEADADVKRVGALSQHLALNQEEASLLAEVLQLVLRLHQRLEQLQASRQSIAEWVTLLEALQEEFLLCRSDLCCSDHNDRAVINTALRNFLATETSLLGGLELAQSAPEPAARTEASDELAPRQYLRFPFAVIRSLLQQKLEQNFSFKGRYLTQGITCASLQPYRSVPFRMICVLGLNEKDFPRSNNPLRFDLCADLPQHLSRQAQEQHIFAELLISAQQRLSLFYQDRDMAKGCDKNPSASLHELAYFIAKILACEESDVWQHLLQVQALFPFDQRYFHSASCFSYSRSAWEQNLALETSYRTASSPQAVQLAGSQVLQAYTAGQDRRCHLLNFRDLLEVLQDAPSFFWQHYSGLKPGTDPDSYQGRNSGQSELPLLEQFAQDEQLLQQSLEPIQRDSWLCQLWVEADYLQQLLPLPPQQQRDFLLREGLLGTPLLQEEHWRSLKRGLQAMRHSVEKQLEALGEGGWPGWQTLASSRQFSVLLQWQPESGSSDLASVADGQPLLPRQQGRLLLSESAVARFGAYLLPAAPLPWQQGLALLEGELSRLWFSGRQLLCWNRSPFRFPPKIYNLLQAKFFRTVQGAWQNERSGLCDSLAAVETLLQLEWVYDAGLQLQVQPLPQLDELRPLADYVWLLWRAACEPLPLTTEFLQGLGSEARNSLIQLVGQMTEAGQTDSSAGHLARLQQLWYEQWQSYMANMEQSLLSGNEQNFGPRLQVREAHRQLGLCFSSETLQDVRFWQIMAELLQALQGHRVGKEGKRKG